MKSLSLIWRLVTQRILRFPSRALITVIGIVASTCAVVWIVSGFDALASQFDENSAKYLGRYDLLLVPNGPPGSPKIIPAETIVELKQDAGILEVNAVNQSRVSVTRIHPDDNESSNESTTISLIMGDRPPVNGAPPLSPTLVGTQAVESPYELASGTWLEASSNELVAVMGANTADEMNVLVGDSIRVTSLANQLNLRVVGLVEQPSDAPMIGGRRGGGKPKGGRQQSGGRRGKDQRGKNQTVGRETAGRDSDSGQKGKPTEQAADNNIGMPASFGSAIASNAVYVKPQIAERLNGHAFQSNVLQIAFREGFSAEQFEEAWSGRLSKLDTPLTIINVDAIKAGLQSSRNYGSRRSQAWAATGMASLAAIFIIFSTISMGVSERTRELAMLRAIALTRFQIGCIVLLESVLLGLLGWLGGLVAGWCMLLLGSQLLPAIFSKGATLGAASLAMSAIAVFGGSIAAAILPAWRATRIRPLEAIKPASGSGYRGNWLVLGLIGFSLVAVAPALVFVAPLTGADRTLYYQILAYPALMLGVVLTTPLTVTLCERFLAPILAKLFGLHHGLVKKQLSTNMWRTIAATLALTIGLGLYTSTQTWGYSMLEPFLPGQWFPDGLVGFHPVGLEESDIQKIREIDGIRKDQVLQLAVEQSKFQLKSKTKSDSDFQANQTMRYDNAVVFGLDADRAFGGDSPLIDVPFVDVDRQEMINALAAGRNCLISEDFQMKSGLQIGDTIQFSPPNSPQETTEYTVAGIIRLPGWHWLTKFSGVRRHFVRTETMIFADRTNVDRDFRLKRPEFFWFNLETNADPAKVEEQLQRLAETRAGDTFATAAVGQVTAYRPFARVTYRSNIDRAIRGRADGMIQAMSYLPLITLLIMSLAIANAILASVKARTYQFGVFRAIGVTRVQLVKLVLLESILIGAAACLISLVFGLIAGWCSVGLSQFSGFFFAGPAPLLIPWSSLAFGFGLTILLCLLAAIFPALNTGLAEPLRLLKAGRSSQ